MCTGICIQISNRHRIVDDYVVGDLNSKLLHWKNDFNEKKGNLMKTNISDNLYSSIISNLHYSELFSPWTHGP